MAQFKDYAVVGTITTFNPDNTRLRNSPSTFTSVYNSYPKGTIVTIDLVREYTESVASEYVKAGDKWGRVIAVNGQPPKNSAGALITDDCWMAIVYLGNQITTPNYTIPTEEPPPPVKPQIVSLTVVEHYDDGTSSDPVDFIPKPIT